MRGGTVLRSGRTAPLLLALPVLAASAMLPWQTGWVCAVAVIVVLGVPHGALDVEIGRNLLRCRVGGWWFPVFAGPYLLLVGAVLLAWHWAPEATLAAFLAASVWHFGTEDTGGSGWPALFRGGLPVAVPVLLHPEATAGVFAAASGLVFEQPPTWLTAASVLWLIPASLTVLRSRPRDLLLPGALCAAFVVLPPLTAFTLYFVAVHAPAHTIALIRHPSRAPRVQDAAAAWRLAAPTTVLTVAIGAALWPTYTAEAPVRLLCLTLQLLAALTLPHMILDAWLERRDQSARTDRRATPPGLAALTLPQPLLRWIALRNDVPANPDAP
ncbi:MAG: Brp/Blh family beta-carotene 15,15'-dioxygenase [Janthinobacterium lividum]